MWGKHKMPKRGWRFGPLESLVTLQRGFDITKKEQEEGPYDVISSSGANSTHSTFKVAGPGVVIGRKGTLGTVFYSERPYWPHDTTLWVKDFHGNHPKFCYYFLKIMGFERFDCGASNPTLNRNHVHQLPIQYPAVAEQCRIASILSAYDDLIENNTRRIKILEDMAQMLYREWFVNFRFPGHEKVRMGESELGPIPKGWEVKRLIDVARVNERSIKSSSPPERIRYIDIASVSTAQIERIDAYNFEDAPGRARRIVRHGDTIWSTVRPNRRSYALIVNPEASLIVSTGFAVLTAVAVPFSYLYLHVTTNQFTDYLTNHATGSAYPAVTGKDFEQALLIIPPASLLTRFHEVVEPMLSVCWCHHQRNQNLRTTRDLLLPKLISGEVSVEAADEHAAELAEHTL
jgi:type I restriction enzyme, S subunit